MIAVEVFDVSLGSLVVDKVFTIWHSIDVVKYECYVFIIIGIKGSGIQKSDVFHCTAVEGSLVGLMRIYEFVFAVCIIF